MATEEVIVAIDPVPEAAVPDVVEGGDGAAAGGKVEKSKKAKEPKAKKPPGPRKPSSYPSYLEMITDAIVTLKEKTGSSVLAIAKFNEEKHKQLPSNFRKLLFFHLKKLSVAQKLVKVKNSFKLPAATLKTLAAPKAVAAATLKDMKPATSKVAVKHKPKPTAKLKETKVKPAAGKRKMVAAKPKPKAAAAAAAKTKAPMAAKPKAAASKAKPNGAPAAPKPVAAKTRPAPRPKPKERPAKVARTTTRSSPGKKAVKASKKVATAVKKAASMKAKAASMKAKAAAKSPIRKASTGRAKK